MPVSPIFFPWLEIGCLAIGGPLPFPFFLEFQWWKVCILSARGLRVIVLLFPEEVNSYIGIGSEGARPVDSEEVVQ